MTVVAMMGRADADLPISIIDGAFQNVFRGRVGGIPLAALEREVTEKRVAYFPEFQRFGVELEVETEAKRNARRL